MMNEQIEAFLADLNVSDVGFAEISDSPFPGLGRAVSLVFQLSDAVLDQIDYAPTMTYFHHYRTTNAYIDHVTERLVLWLLGRGYGAAAIPASQSTGEYCGAFSHKKAAVLANLGSIGKSALFLSRKFGPRVRLGTVFTDAPLKTEAMEYRDLCGACRLCTEACGAMAIRGVNYAPGMAREELLDAHACSHYMKTEFQHIGRGAVCGVCVAVCPRKNGEST